MRRDLLQVGAGAEHSLAAPDPEGRYPVIGFDRRQCLIECLGQRRIECVDRRPSEGDRGDGPIDGEAERRGAVDRAHEPAPPVAFFGGLRKRGGRFSRKAMPPSRDSSVS